MSDAATKRRRVRAYLLDQTATSTLYTKSRQVAAALDEEFSSKEVGQAMLALSESASDLVIEQWSYTKATTWRVQQVPSSVSNAQSQSNSEARP